MKRDRNLTVSVLVLFVSSVGLTMLLSGCFSLSSALSYAMGSRPADSNSSGGQSQTSSQPAPDASANPPAQSKPTNTEAYRSQFGSFYSAFWNMGWFGYGNSEYKPGQGTVWQFSGGSSENEVSFERAYLKANGDGTQWWRFAMSSEGKDYVFEMLVNSDGTVQKVRFKDPESGTVGEFVPAQSNAPSRAPAIDQSALSKSLVGHEQTTVPAGSYPTDHYAYTDPQNSYTFDVWIDQSLPGAMVKFSGKSPQNKVVSQGQLMKIESGVTTQLGSY